MESKQKYIILGMVIMTMLMVSLVVAVDDYTTVEEQSYWEHIKYKLKQIGLFTAVGQARECSATPGATYNQPAEQGLDSSVMMADAGCTSSALVNSFTTNWIFTGEYTIEEIGFGIISGTDSIMEVYCCPYPPCSSDSDCDAPYGDTCDSVYNSCYYDLPSHQTEVYECDGDGNWDFLGRAPYGLQKWCVSPSDEHYIRAGDNIGGCYSSAPSGWCVEPCTPSNSCATNTCIGLSCSDGCDGNIPGTKDCSGGNGGGGDVCGDGICQSTETISSCSLDCGTGGIDDDLSNIIEVTNIDIPSGESSNYGSQDEDFRVTVKNTDTKARTVSIEAGFYTYDYADDIAQLFSTYAIVNPVETCVNEPFVKQVDVTLSAGESKRVVIEMPPTNAYITLPLATYNLEDVNLVPFLGVMTHEGDNACCQKLSGLEGCVEGTGGYIDFNYDTSYYIGGTALFENERIICNSQVYGKIDYKVVGEDTITISRPYTDCIDFIFYTESGEVNETATIGTDINARQIGLTKSQMKTATTQTLISSACTQSNQCDNESQCDSLQSLVEKGVLTDIQARDMANAIGTEIGTLVGATGGVYAGVACSIYLGTATAGVALPICGVVGLAVGLGLDNFFDSLAEKDLEKTGICIKEGGDLDTYFGWASFFDITGDGAKDGTDGLIIVLILGGVAILLIRR